MSRRNVFRLVSSGLALVALLLAWRILFVQPLSVTSEDSTVQVDLRRLGEYYANLVRLRLIDVTKDAVIVELEAVNQTTPVFVLTLQRGLNPSNLGIENVREHGQALANSFVLTSGRRYRLETWTLMDFGVVSHRQASFEFQ